MLLVLGRLDVPLLRLLVSLPTTGCLCSRLLASTEHPAARYFLNDTDLSKYLDRVDKKGESLDPIH